VIRTGSGTSRCISGITSRRGCVCVYTIRRTYKIPRAILREIPRSVRGSFRSLHVSDGARILSSWCAERTGHINYECRSVRANVGGIAEHVSSALVIILQRTKCNGFGAVSRVKRSGYWKLQPFAYDLEKR